MTWFVDGSPQELKPGHGHPATPSRIYPLLVARVSGRAENTWERSLSGGFGAI